MLFQVISALFSLSPTTTGDLADFTNPTPATDVLTEHPFMAFLVVAVFCLIFGAIVALVYARTQRDEPLSTNFVLTLSALPMVIAILVMLVSDNIARAFSLAGIFALVRFRSVQSDPKDLTSVLFCMAIGLAGGLKLLAYSACGVVLFAVLMIAAWLLKGIGGSSRTRCRIKITVPENMCWEDTFNEVLEKYTKKCVLARIKTVELGSFFELAYDVTLRPDVDEKAMIDELRQRNGNLTILVNKQPDYAYGA
jgi:flagellar biosynthesis protein FliQ